MQRSSLFVAVMAGAVLLSSGPAAPAAKAGAFPARRGLRIAPQTRTSGSYLGIAFIDLDASRAAALKLGDERGVEVGYVQPGSPAESAGLKPGDVLFTYNGENILGAQQFVRLVQETPPGRRVKIQFWRDGKVQAVTVTTGVPPSQTGNFPPIVGFDFPDRRSIPMYLPDYPNPMLVWKNSLLGIECEPIESQLAQYFGVKRGALVRSVDKGSPAERAGLRAGDVVTTIGNRSVSSPRDVTSYIRTGREPGKSIAVSIVRDHKELTLNVFIEERQ